MATKFHYENMQKHMQNLEADFSYFADTLKKANDIVNDYVSVSPASSIYGEKAKKVLNLWNQNASTFGDFYQNFESWASLLVNASNQYRHLEADVFSSNQTTGATADGVAKNRASLLNSNGFTMPDGSTIQYLKDDNGDTYALLEKNGVKIKRVFQEDGSYLDYDAEGNLLTPLVEEILDEPPTDVVLDTVTVSSGQAVNLNGEDCYFLMRDSSGNDYYVKDRGADAQVFITDSNGNLIPYTEYGSDKIVSREAFVSDRKYNMDYQWNVTYNNGTSPYQKVSNQIDSSFTENVKNADYTKIVYDPTYLQENAVSLEALNYNRTEGNENFPSVVYLAPGQSIKYDVPWDTYDNVIKGGEQGAYMVYDPEKQAYFKIDENGSYNSRNGTDEIRGLFIPVSQLLSDRVTINK